jgi:LCP family protein required for cell wall assembly
LLVAMAALSLAAAGGATLVGAQGATHVDLRGAYPTEQSGLIFVAAMGSDSPTGAPDVGGGCDAIHIIAINSHTQSGTILNMPRDSFINGRKMTDICRATGFDNGVAVIRSYTGIPVQYWAHTNFSNFMPLIDSIGGLDIHVYQAMFNQADTGTHFNPGDYHMLGGDTLAFSRDRYNTPGGDFGRSTDQAQIIISGFRKFSKLDADMGYIFDLIKDGRQRLAFNVPVPELVRLALLARLISPANVKSCTLAGSSATVNGASVVMLAGSNSAIFQQVAKDASLPPGASCFEGVNGLIPPG